MYRLRVVQEFRFNLQVAERGTSQAKLETLNLLTSSDSVD
jgi:hypothetical protein